MMKKILLFFSAVFFTVSLFASTVDSLAFDEYGNLTLSEFESYNDDFVVTITLSISNAASSVDVGWGVGTISPIGNYDDLKYDFTCQAVSAEGAENTYTFTIAEFKEFAKVDGEYYVDAYDRSGVVLNLYNGATIKSIVVTGSDGNGGDSEVEDVTWNFSTFGLGEYTADTTINGLTIYAADNKKVTIDENGKTIDDYEFTQRLKLGGSGSFNDDDTPYGRVLAFDVAGACDITVYGMSSSSSSERMLMIATADGTILDSLVTTGLASITVNYTGEAGTIYMYSASSGFNLYLVDVAAPAVKQEAVAWNFSTFGLGDYLADTTINDLTIYAADNKKVTIDENGKTIDDYEFTQRLKLGGSGSFNDDGTPYGRVLAFNVSGDCAITVYGMSSSSSSERMLMIAKADGTILDSLVTTGLASKTVNYTGGTGTIYMYSASSGFNLYLIKIGEIGENPEDVESAAITFIVDDSELQTGTGYAIKGSWDTATGVYDSTWTDGAEHATFYDDGTNGDEVADDHIWTVTLGLVPDAGANTWKWGVNDADGNWIDGDFEFTVADTVPQTLTYTIEEQVVPDEMAAITFIVDDSKYKTSPEGFALKGSWGTETGLYDSSWSNGAEHASFYDDGTNGDETASDNIWTVTVELAPDSGTNTWEWGFNNANSEWVKGNFQFTVVDATAQTLTSVIGDTGVEDMFEAGFSVYPNPASSSICISAASGVNNLKIYSTNGAVVKTASFENNINLNIENLQKGVYIISLQSQEGVTSSKLIVQ